MHLSIKIQVRKQHGLSGERISRVSSFRKAIFRRLGGLVLKEEQKEAITLLLQGKDVLAVLSTGFGRA